MNVIELTKSLIQIPSPSGQEQKICRYVKTLLESCCKHVTAQDVANGRFNLFGYDEDPKIILTTHLDTVSPVLPFHEDNHYLYGRGASDAKGILASQIKTYEKCKKRGMKHIGLLFLVGEEGGSDGARAANSLKNQCQTFINGEPTDNKLAVGSKGALRVEIETKGVSAHSAYPEEGESAIMKLLHILNKINDTTFPANTLLGDTTWNIGILSGGTQANVIPDYAKTEIMFRTVSKKEHVQEKLEDIVKNRGDIEYKFVSDPVQLEEMKGFDKTVVSFATDIPLLSNWGKPFLMGPGSIRDAHTQSEKISKKELKIAVELYFKLINKITT